MMDDFSFPTVAVDEDPLAPFPHFAPSPFFCFLSSAGDQQPFEDAEATMKKTNPKVDSAESSRRFVDEERMDMLWEDFNDETSRKLSNSSSSSIRSCKSEQQRGSLIHRRRPSLIVMVKVLKKLLLIQKAAASSKRKQHHSSTN
ncbi:uncharacterized protein LOC122054113 [Zingiber officinale]|uniref:uncharacterized protein LOC122054113 n=1 Tax=Zingiber officinale TaxID=94328 RepID=UPI001C4C21E4|nr:uncharacterized protein LOC122054113 [Zingiber officinale]